MKKTIEQTAGGRTRIRKGDEVIVIAGSDKDMTKARRVLAVYPKIDRILVEGVRVAKRSYKKGSNAQLPQGGIHEKGLPIHISNVMLVDPKNGGPTRIGIKTETKDGKTIRTRFAKASGTDIND